MSKFKTMDGNEAAAWVSYAFTEVAAIYLQRASLLWQNMSMIGQPLA